MKSIYFSTLFFICCAFSLQAQSLEDVDKIKVKLYRIALDRSLVVDMEVDCTIEEMIGNMNDLGNWADIDYLDKTPSKWKPAMHLKRLFEMSRGYRNTSSIHYGDAHFRELIESGIRFWVADPPQAANYWWNAIGAANLLGGICILMEDDLDKTLMKSAVEVMKVGVKPAHYEYFGKATGQNLLWIGYAHLFASCLMNDIEEIRRVFTAVSEEIVVSENEGIQPDYSFYQHGRQNYAWGYGKGFAYTAVQYIYLAHKTAFQLPAEKIEIVSKFLLDGQQWMSRYNVLEYTAMGREISRKHIDRLPILKSLMWMEEIDPDCSNEYQAFYNRLSGNREENPLVGNRYFWRSDLMVHHRPNYYFSLKGTSNRILSGESGNGENLKGWYQGNGTFYLVRSGKEYENIFPIFDWRKLPGLLVEQKSGTLPLFLWGEGSQGATPFVYGLSDGQYGCFGYDYKKENVIARRSWFFFDNEIMNLVSNASGNSLYQSINQCLLNGDVWNDLKSERNNVDRVFHDSVGYCISTNKELVLKTEKQIGSWKDINLAASSEPISKEVFSLGISLGSNVENQSYSYTIVPGISLEQFKKYNIHNHIQILSNSNNLQSVYQKEIEQVQAVFFTEGSIQLPWKELYLKMKNPGLIMVQKVKSKLIVDYSQPTERKHIEIDLNNKTAFQNTEIEVRN